MTEVPAGFPLAAGMGEGARTARGADAEALGGMAALDLCGEAPLADLDVRDRMAADNSGGEAADTRDLVLLDTPEDVAAAARAVGSAAGSCPEQREGGTVIDTQVHLSPFGARGRSTILRTFEVDGRPSPSVMVHHVVPEGNSLLVTSTYGEWADPTDGITETAARLAETVAALDALHALAEDAGATATDPGSSTAGPVTGLPPDLDLMEGLVEDGGDYDVVPPGVEGADIHPVRMCGEQVWPVPGAEVARRLVTTGSGPEHFDGRELLLLRHEATAVQMVADFRDASQSCRRHRTEVWTPLPQDTGHDSVTMGISYVEGMGSAVLQMTRVGAVVLFVVTYGEGSLDTLPSQAAEVTRNTRDITRQLTG